jgi:hypothetical protein
MRSVTSIRGSNPSDSPTHEARADSPVERRPADGPPRAHHDFESHFHYDAIGRPVNSCGLGEIAGLPWRAEQPTTGPRDAGQEAIYVGALKLIRSGSEQKLYDLDADPGETRDLAPERAADVARLGRKLAHLLPMLDTPGVVPRPEVVGQLRSLGYVR